MLSNYNRTFRLRVEWKAVILAKGQSSSGKKCTKSAFLTTNFGRKYLCQSVQELRLPTNIVSKFVIFFILFKEYTL